jgi:hypothetical protein
VWQHACARQICLSVESSARPLRRILHDCTVALRIIERE